ncbi:MAG: di-trans,poly-cis-decaprenylcistransferase [Candidatus Marinimicrobia bacterium]|nr:di-trans,poly-cis-decaprenylcistransferase [Candidatus Neomarinimicrobiota bacterium]
MDGNGRWALNKNLDRFKGHEKGVRVVKEVTKYCSEIGVKYLTLYTFSNENWKRPANEVISLMKLFRKTLIDEINLILENDIKFKVIGDKTKLDILTRKKIDDLESKTKNNKNMQLILALSYGSRQEIITAVNNLLRKNKNKVNLDDFINSLFTRNIPDPDILIRTGFEKRISNFLLWQIAYSEIFFIDEYWPNFNKKILKNIIKDYNLRERRYGKLD